MSRHKINHKIIEAYLIGLSKCLPSQTRPPGYLWLQFIWWGGECGGSAVRILGYATWWGAADMSAAVHQAAPSSGPPPGLLSHLHHLHRDVAAPPPPHNPDVLLALLARNKSLEGKFSLIVEYAHSSNSPLLIKVCFLKHMSRCST